MILSDREIRAALERGSIRITPDPRADASLWSSTAVDLRLGEPVSTWMFPAGNIPRTFQPGDPGYDLPALIAQFLRPVERSGEGFLIEPGRFYLGWTRERIQLPHRARIGARVEGKSSLARLGLGVHVTAPTIHAGFGATDMDPSFAGNPIQLEIWNTGPLPASASARAVHLPADLRVGGRDAGPRLQRAILRAGPGGGAASTAVGAEASAAAARSRLTAAVPAGFLTVGVAPT